MSEQVQVREGWWRQRCGDIVRVWRSEEDADYPWESAHSSYMEDGAEHVGFHDGGDLVEFVSEDDPTRKPAQDDRRELVRRLAVAFIASGRECMMHEAWKMAEEMADAEPQSGGAS